jgi:chromosome segregation ATPase
MPRQISCCFLGVEKKRIGEMDTKPIETVAISMFEEKSDKKGSHSSASSDVFFSLESKEKDAEFPMKEVANYKLQLEAKEYSAHMLALVSLEHYQNSADELSTLLQNSNAEREKSTKECEKERTRIKELELKITEMADQALESETKLEELSGLYNARAEVLRLESELGDLKNKIIMIKQASREAENKKDSFIATEIQAEEHLEDFRKKLELMKELENRDMDKSILIDSLQLQIKQANEVLMSNEKANCENSAKLVAVIENLERKNTYQTIYIEGLEKEKNKLNLELENANSRIEMFTGELKKAKTEIDVVKEKENESKIEKTILESEIRKVRVENEFPEDKEIKPEGIALSLHQEYEFPTTEADKAREIPKPITENPEIERLGKELEMVKARIAEFRTRSEQAITRADSAERAKSMLQAQLRKHREQRQKRKAALEALKEDCVSVHNPNSSYCSSPEIYQPLGQILNMEF